MQHSLFFVVEPVNQVGQIIGPAPVFCCTKSDTEPTIINTYSILTNGVNKKLSAYLDADMPRGTSLWLKMAPPTNARTLGYQKLSTTPVDLVIEITEISETELALEYLFKSTPEAGIIEGTSRIIFYTLIDGS